jgi:hypothetical protein
MSRVTTSTLLFTVVLIVLPSLIFWGERAYDEVWKQPLLLKPTVSDPPIDTVLEQSGTFIPATISTSITYTATDSPLIITEPTTIPTAVTVTIEPGVDIVVNEFASLDVFGTLLLSGTAAKPIQLRTNQANPDQQTWAGILAHPGGVLHVSHATITDASPGISCLKDSTAAVSNVDIAATLVGIYIESDNCRMTDSRIRATEDGIVAVGIKPSITNTTISAGQEEVRVLQQLTTDD